MFPSTLPNRTTVRHPGRRALLAFAAVMCLPALARAQAVDHGSELSLIVTGTATGIIVLGLFFIVFVLKGDIDPLVAACRTIWDYVVPKAKEKAMLFDEDYDGIAELDNRIPPWFNYLFAGTIVFAVIYMLSYHVWGARPLPQAEYAEEQAAADLLRRVRIAAEGTIDEATLSILPDGESLKSGQERFAKNCASCHGARGEGLVGPNLTDQYWIHGGGIRDVYATIKNGVPAKGMISWKLVFTPKEMQQLASYVLMLQGTRPPNAKKPEGELYAPPAQAGTDTTRSAI